MGQKAAVIWWFLVELPIEEDFLSAYRVVRIVEALLSLVAMFIALSSVATRQSRPGNMGINREYRSPSFEDVQGRPNFGKFSVTFLYLGIYD